MTNNPEQLLYGIAAEYRSMRRRWLQYIFATSALIVILSFAFALALTIALATEKMIFDFIVASIITIVFTWLTLIYAKYTQVKIKFF